MAWSITDGRIDRLAVFRHEAEGPVPVGELRFEGAGRQRFGRFAYTKAWADRWARAPFAGAIDPLGLPIRKGWASGTPAELPLAFYDAGPDGWGKAVMEAAYPERQLGMAEFLALGGSDRTGDLAFGPSLDEPPQRWEPEGSQRSAGSPVARRSGASPIGGVGGPEVPGTLEALLEAADALERGDPMQRHLRLLLHSSADIGGARPKARLEADGRYWIVKFPTARDPVDEPRLEAVGLDLAEAAGVPVTERRLITIGGRTALMVDRFDRAYPAEPGAAGPRRMGYLSVATLLKQAPADYRTNLTYVDVAAAAERIGSPDPARDTYRRMLVNQFLRNSDDHLRNLAFLRDGRGWQMAPGFDLVPQRSGRHMVAPAPGVAPDNDPAAAAASYRAFGLSAEDARGVFDQVVEGVAGVRQVLAACEVSPRDREIVEPILKACADPPAWRPAAVGARPPRGRAADATSPVIAGAASGPALPQRWLPDYGDDMKARIAAELQALPPDELAARAAATAAALQAVGSDALERQRLAGGLRVLRQELSARGLHDPTAEATPAPPSPDLGIEM